MTQWSFILLLPESFAFSSRSQLYQHNDLCPLVSSFLLRGHRSCSFNPITADWWHQVQSCDDLTQKPAAGISRGWRAVGQHRSVSAKQVKKKENSWWAHSRLFSLSTGGPAIQQVRAEWFISKNGFNMKVFWTFSSMKPMLYISTCSQDGPGYVR